MPEDEIENGGQQIDALERDALIALATLKEKMKDRLYYKPGANGTLVDVRHLDDGTLKETTLTKSILEHHLRRYFMGHWAKEYIKDIATHIILNYNSSDFRVLHEIHAMPVLRPDFTLVHAGYDAETGHLYQPVSKVRAHEFNEKPTQKQAKAAFEKLKYPFSDFPFMAEADLTNTIAFVLTLVSRSALSSCLCPAMVTDASGQSSGKSLHGEAVSLITQGKKMKWVAMDKGITEVEKGVKSELVAHQRLIGIDNIVGTFRSAVITSLLTSYDPSIRNFGTLTRLSGTKDANFMLNGNGMKFDTDMRKRVYWVKMWHEDPGARDKRKFQVYKDHGTDLITYLSANWLEYYNEAMTIVQAWRVAGMPQRKPSSPLDKYGMWESNIGGMVEFAGGKDFLKGHADHSLAADDELQTVVKFIELVLETFPESKVIHKGVSKSKLVEKLMGEWKGILPEIEGGTEVMVKNNFGKWVSKKFGLNIGGYILDEKHHPKERCLTIRRA